MKISIITVSYNSSQTIQKTFDSIRSQTYTDLEYIVVDGNSTDGTLDLIQANQDIIDEWISESDIGLYDAMNKGIKRTTGDIIGILNSDDVFKDNKVLENIAVFHKQNDVEASVGNIIQRNDRGKIVRTYNSNNWEPEKLKIGFMPPHPSIFFKKDLFEKWGDYPLDYKMGADYELIVRFFLKHNISWKYSEITTTSMLVGGISSSGVKSYNLATREIKKALLSNEIEFSSTKIDLRLFWKIADRFQKEIEN